MPQHSPQARPVPVTEYFSGLASTYADHRPTYPAAAIDWILSDLPHPLCAADVGCGTGISSRLLAERGVRIVGIDPNPDMLAQAQEQSLSRHDITYRRAASDDTGLADGSVGLILCAQSFHWFDPALALREFHRIAAPRARLALMWNVKTPANSFSADFVRVAEGAQHDAARRGLHVPPERGADAAVGGYFTNIRRREFSNPQRLSLPGVLGRARSASYFPKSGPARERFERELTQSFELNQTDGFVVLEHATDVTLADRAEVSG